VKAFARLRDANPRTPSRCPAPGDAHSGLSTKAGGASLISSKVYTYMYGQKIYTCTAVHVFINTYKYLDMPRRRLEWAT
jgi:hypothetical protein